MFRLPSLLRWRRTAPRWRSLCEIESAAAAEIASARCRFSLTTVEVMTNPAATFCALVEQELPGAWRWAVYGVEDIPRAQGLAPEKAAARRLALKALVALDRKGSLKLPEASSGAPPIHGGALT